MPCFLDDDELGNLGSLGACPIQRVHVQLIQQRYRMRDRCRKRFPDLFPSAMGCYGRLEYLVRQRLIAAEQRTIALLLPLRELGAELYQHRFHLHRVSPEKPDFHPASRFDGRAGGHAVTLNQTLGLVPAHPGWVLTALKHTPCSPMAPPSSQTAPAEGAGQFHL